MPRTILHLDMDCFFAAIEERDNPELRGRPVAVGGGGRRGILCTANYPARKFGCRSAMPTFQAMQRCPHLVVLPVRYELYKRVSREIRKIMRLFSDLVEPLSLDEAYLDISHLRSSPEAVARQLRALVRDHTGLTASVGVAPNKLLAKIASDWNKPDGQFCLGEEQIDEFLETLPVARLWGVGKRTREALQALRIETCGQLRQVELPVLLEKFGKFGLDLYWQSRGRDDREVQPFRIAKSCAVETTLEYDVDQISVLAGTILPRVVEELRDDVGRSHADRQITGVGVKLKFADFRQTTVESVSEGWRQERFGELLEKGFRRGKGKAVRLVGAFVRFADPRDHVQLDFLDVLDGKAAVVATGEAGAR